MDEEIIKAILESSKNDQTILKALSQLLDDMAEVKAGLAALNGKQQ